LTALDQKTKIEEKESIVSVDASESTDAVAVAFLLALC
jgi:hypothetical protein